MKKGKRLKIIRLYNRSSVALGVLELSLELIFKCRVRLAEVDIHVFDAEKWENMACQKIEFAGFAHLGSKVLGSRDKSGCLAADVVLVNAKGPWQVAWVDVVWGMVRYRVHCEYVNCPSSGHVLYPSHLCINRESYGSLWDEMDTDAGVFKSIGQRTYNVRPHTPLISCENGCGRESPIHFFKQSDVGGQRRWLCSCYA